MAGTLKRHSNGGFTLVELMVTLAISAMLVVAMYALFGDQEKLYATEEQIIQMQQNARVAMDMISRDVRMAGFFGCGSTAANFTDTVRKTGGLLFDMAPIDGVDNVAKGNAYSAKEGTDVLVLSYGKDNATCLVDSPPMNNDSADIHLASAGVLNKGDIAIISDCTYTSVFQVTNLQKTDNRSVVHNTNQGGGNPNPANIQNGLGHVFLPGSRVYKLTQKYYWLNSNDQLRVGTGGYDAVSFNWSPNNQTTTVAEGIQNLQFEYGVDTNGDGKPDQWQVGQSSVSANSVANWNNVVAVRIYILARTARPEKDYVNRKTYTSGDGTLTFGPYNDGYHRYFLERTVAIRNRWQR